jgi:hypothetical protein
MSVSCRDFTVAEVCYTDGLGARQTLIAHYEYRANAGGGTVVHAVRYTTADGVPVDTSTGTVVTGACALIPPDVEWTKLCDVQASGVVVEFWQQIVTSFTTAGVPIVPSLVTNYAIDKVTAYAPTGTVVECPQECDVVAPVGVVSTWG